MDTDLAHPGSSVIGGGLVGCETGQYLTAQRNLEFRDGRCRHAAPQDQGQRKIVLVSNCGLWELENFTPLLTHIEAYCNNMVRAFAGALLRPHSRMF